jgi:hypothetical protein
MEIIFSTSLKLMSMIESIKTEKSNPVEFKRYLAFDPKVNKNTYSMCIDINTDDFIGRETGFSCQLLHIRRYSISSTSKINCTATLGANGRCFGMIDWVVEHN